MKYLKDKFAAIEMDQIGYLLLGLILLLILIYIISSIIAPEVENQGDKVIGIFDMFK